jgi:vacuolar-type H+-ATPase subunit F/Vma7
MKKLYLLIIGILLYVQGLAQDDVITKYFDEYERRDDFTTIIITSRMFELIAQIPESEDQEDVMNVIRKLNGLKILTTNEYPERGELSKKAVKILENQGFEELMIIKEGEEEIKFLIDEKDGHIREFVMLIAQDENGDFFLMSMTGNLELEDISKLSKTLDIDGFENLEKVDKQ